MSVRVVGVYRLLYGSDFIAESLASVYDACDAILCFVGRRPFGGRNSVRYFGREVFFPHDIDGVGDAIRAWASEHDAASKIRIIENPHDALLKNQLGTLVDRYVLPGYDCTHVLQVECDEVWHADAMAALLHAMEGDADEILSINDLFWRSPRYVSRRQNPYAVARRITDRTTIGETGNALMSVRDDLRRVQPERVRVHNFGYASSARTMFWKHLAGLSFSRDLGLDSTPREEWFEDVWRPWNWHANRRTDLCPSIGYPDAFAPAEPYPLDDLPASIRWRLQHDPLAEWLEAERREPVAEGAA
ncbi:MAG: hypothetical protein AAFX79_11040 [Planctomycetota bacterium]